MGHHSGPRGFPGGGKLRPENGARSGGSAAAPVRPMKGLNEASRRPPWFSQGGKLRPENGARSGGSAAAPVRPMKGLHEASRLIRTFPGGGTMECVRKMVSGPVDRRPLL